jgi:hypothetical protein
VGEGLGSLSLLVASWGRRERGERGEILTTKVWMVLETIICCVNFVDYLFCGFYF